jgi:hypothetical protein
MNQDTHYERSKTMFTIEMGVKVKSKISGFQGVVVSRAEHLNGCNRYWIQPPVDKDGKLIDGYWLDEQELTVLEDDPVTTDAPHRKPGGFPSRVR